MLPSTTAQATGLKDSRINVRSDRDTQSRDAEKDIGTKPRGATGATASNLESRLKKARREAFNLLGGED